MWFSHQSNCGVLTAGRWTQEIAIGMSSCRSSLRIESVKPTIACFAPQ
jgi:hypothetical protein